MHACTHTLPPAHQTRTHASLTLTPSPPVQMTPCSCCTQAAPPASPRACCTRSAATWCTLAPQTSAPSTCPVGTAGGRGEGRAGQQGGGEEPKGEGREAGASGGRGGSPHMAEQPAAATPRLAAGACVLPLTHTAACMPGVNVTPLPCSPPTAPCCPAQVHPGRAARGCLLVSRAAAYCRLPGLAPAAGAPRALGSAPRCLAGAPRTAAGSPATSPPTYCHPRRRGVPH